MSSLEVERCRTLSVIKNQLTYSIKYWRYKTSNDDQVNCGQPTVGVKQH